MATRPWKDVLLLGSILMNGLLGVAGLFLWLTLVWSIGSWAGGGNCIVRIAGAPAVALIWAGAGIAVRKTPRRAGVVVAYVVLGLLVSFFALYGVLFLSWAIRVWPDHCICAC